MSFSSLPCFLHLISAKFNTYDHDKQATDALFVCRRNCYVTFYFFGLLWLFLSNKGER